MWLTAVECIVDLVSNGTTISASNVLHKDLDGVEGHKTLVYSIRNSSVERSIQMMSVVSRLLFDQGKEVDEPISYPSMGIIFSSLLVGYIGNTIYKSITINFDLSNFDDTIPYSTSPFCAGLEIPIQKEYVTDELIRLTREIYTRSDSFAEQEYLLQNLVFTLLTIYSNNPVNCIILEEHFNFVPTLIVSFPTVSTSELSQSILKVLNYVCQCVDKVPQSSIAALCAVNVVLLDLALNERNDFRRDIAKNKFLTVCEAIENIIRDRGQGALDVILHYGMMKLLFTGPFETLEKSMSSSSSNLSSSSVESPDIMTKSEVQIYSAIMGLLVVIIEICPKVLVELRRSTLEQIVRSLIASSLTGPDFTSNLLRLTERLVYTDSVHIEQHVLVMINLLSAMKGKYGKSNCVLNCLCRVFINQPTVPDIWDRIAGSTLLLDLLNGMKDDVNSENSVVADAAYRSFECIMHTIIITITISNSNRSNSVEFAQSSHWKVKSLATALLKIRIFASKFGEKCVDLIFKLITAQSPAKVVKNAEGVELILEICCQVEPKIGLSMVTRLQEMLHASPEGRKSVRNARIVKHLLCKFPGIFTPDEDSPHRQTLDVLASVLKDVLRLYLTAQDLATFIAILVRPEITVQSMGRLIPPHMSLDENSIESEYGAISERPWSHIKLLYDICVEGLKSNAGVPSVRIDSSSYSMDQKAYPYVVTKLYGQSDAHTSSGHIAFTNTPSTNTIAGSATIASGNSSINGSINGNSSGSGSLKVLKWNKFAFSMWMKFCFSSEDFTGVFTPIMAVASTDGHSYFEFHYHPTQLLLRVYTRHIETNEFIFVDFKTPQYVQGEDWMNVVVSCENAGVMMVRSEVSVYINGISCENLNEKKLLGKFDVSTEKDVEMYIGKSFIGNITNLSPFELGPYLFFDEILTQEQSTRIYLKGPRYR